MGDRWCQTLFLFSPTDNQIFNNRVTKTTSCTAEKNCIHIDLSKINIVKLFVWIIKSVVLNCFKNKKKQTNKMYKRFIRSFYSDHRRSLQFPIIHDVHWQITVNEWYNTQNSPINYDLLYTSVTQCCGHTVELLFLNFCYRKKLVTKRKLLQQTKQNKTHREKLTCSRNQKFPR